MQLLAILQIARPQLQWSAASGWVYSIISLTPLSSAGWVSVDCMLPPEASPVQAAYMRVLLFAVIVPGECVHQCTAS